MREPAITKKSKSIKDAMKYEKIRELRSRRYELPEKEVKNILKPSSYSRLAHNSLVVLHEVFIYIRRNGMLIGVIGFLTGVWMSGFYAHAGRGFESLLSAVVAVALLILGTAWSTKQ